MISYYFFLLLYHWIIYFRLCILFPFNNFLLLQRSFIDGGPLENQPKLKGDPPYIIENGMKLPAKLNSMERDL